MPFYLTASALSYGFADGTILFDAVDLALGPGRAGLIGKNGAGKSTLLRLLAGVLAPRAGSIRHLGKVALVTDRTEGTVADLLGVARSLARLTDAPEEVEDWDIERRARDAMARAGVAPRRLFDSAARLSGGERMRIALAGCELTEPDVILLDEPSNHLDRPAREWLYAFLDRWRAGVLVASHDRELLDHLDVIYEIDRGKLWHEDAILLERTSAAHALAAAESSLARAKARANHDRERQAKRTAHAITRAPSLGLPRIILGMRERAGQVTEGKVRTKHERLVGDATSEFREAKVRVGRGEALKLDLPTPEIPARRIIVETALFTLIGPRKVALTGPNGSGKTMLLKSIVAREVKVGVERVAYLDQDLRQLDDRLTLLENVKRLAPGIDEEKLRARLGRVLFAGDSSTKPAGALSGGERLRATLTACLLGEPPPQLLLLDEPTNHLDLAAMRELERVLGSYRGALIVVSHDERFLDAIGIEERWELKKA